MTNIAIIGGGLAASLLLINLVRKNTKQNLRIFWVAPEENFPVGTAYKPYTKQLLLNVPASKMSIFPEKNDHFLDWIIENELYKNTFRPFVKDAYMPRYLFGNYVEEQVVDHISMAQKKEIEVQIIHKKLEKIIKIYDNKCVLQLSDAMLLEADFCVFATGNELLINHEFVGNELINSGLYFQNPWNAQVVQGLDPNLPVCILGNGLTMVDTVLAILEKQPTCPIISLSPHGFNILPHRHNHLQYPFLQEDLKQLQTWDLPSVLSIVKKHIKFVRKLGLSAEPVIDSLRNISHIIWRNFSLEEKRIFLNKLRHLWGVARHRIPMHIYDKILEIRLKGQLNVYAGKVDKIEFLNGKMFVVFRHKKNGIVQKVQAQRIINCTGPMTAKQSLYQQAFADHWLAADQLNIGLKADPDHFRLFSPQTNDFYPHLFAIGSLLKGELWESTALKEIREQANHITDIILQKNI